jgi:hypothetical protein
MAAANPSGFRDAGGVARAAIWALIAYSLLAGASAIRAWAREFDPYTPEQDFILPLASLLLFLACAVIVLRWIYLANANARALGAGDMMVTPGLAVGWFFVPLANLAMPFIAMRELWKASSRPKDWQLVRVPLAIAFWWAFWLASGIAGGIAFRLSWTGDQDVAGAAEVFDAASRALGIPAALLLAWIIRGVQELQASPEHLTNRFA